MNKFLNSNILINYLSSIVAAGVGFIFLPQYLKFITLEEYGVIGFISALQTWLTLIDFGFPTIISREIAKRKNNITNSFATLFYTIERYYFLIIIGLSILGFLIFLFYRTTAVNLIIKNIFFISLIVSIRMIENIYKSALIGFEKHFTYNSLSITFNLLRSILTLIILKYISPTLQAFFLSQLLFTLFFNIILRYKVFGSFPINIKFNYDIKSLKEIKTFSVGLFGTSIVTLLLTAFDKIYLPNIVPLKDYGIYMIFITIMGVFYSFLTPLINVWFPKFCEKVANKDESEISKSFYSITMQISAILGSLIIFSLIFSEDLLNIYFKNVEINNYYIQLFKIMLISVLMNIYFYIPYELQLANSWVSLVFKSNLISLFFTIPLSVYFFPKYGVIVAPLLMILLHIGYIIFQLPIIFKKFTYLSAKKWILNQILIPLFCIYIFFYIIHWVYKTVHLNSVLLKVVGISFSFLFGFFIVSTLIFFNSKIKIYILGIFKNNI